MEYIYVDLVRLIEQQQCWLTSISLLVWCRLQTSAGDAWFLEARDTDNGAVLDLFGCHRNHLLPL